MRFQLNLAASIVAASLLSSCDDPNAPNPLSGMRPIVFVGRTWALGEAPLGDPQLYIVRPDGSGLRRLTSRAGEEFAPAWSPDGRSIAFSTGPEMWIVNADGSSPKQVQGAPGCDYVPPTHLSWSPDGTRIVAGCWDWAHVVSLQGGGSYSLTQRVGGYTEYPDWSPIEDRIAYNAGPFADDSVRTVRSDGTDVQPLLRGRGEEAAWSPDGRRVAYLGGPDGVRTLMISNADGSGAYEVIERSVVPGIMFGPEWSPDGQWLTFHAESSYCENRGSPPTRVCDFHWGVYVVRVNGRDLRKISPITLQSARPTW